MNEVNREEELRPGDLLDIDSVEYGGNAVIRFSEYESLTLTDADQQIRGRFGDSVFIRIQEKGMHQVGNKQHPGKLYWFRDTVRPEMVFTLFERQGSRFAPVLVKVNIPDKTT